MQPDASTAGSHAKADTVQWRAGVMRSRSSGLGCTSSTQRAPSKRRARERALSALRPRSPAPLTPSFETREFRRGPFVDALAAAARAPAVRALVAGSAADH